MQLTLNSIDDILRSGEINNSELAKKFISRLYSSKGIIAVACYIQSGSHIYLPKGEDFSQIIKRKDIQFINEAILTVYILPEATQNFSDEAKMKNEISECFSLLTKEENAAIDYPRDFLPEEIAYYGWYSAPKKDWDTERVIPQKEASSSSLAVFVECFDELAIYRCLCDNIHYINDSPLLKELGAKAYCGFCEDTASTSYYVILPSDKMTEKNEDKIYTYFSSEVFELISKKDKFGFISRASLKPIITEWNALTETQKYSLLRN